MLHSCFGLCGPLQETNNIFVLRRCDSLLLYIISLLKWTAKSETYVEHNFRKQNLKYHIQIHLQTDSF